MNNEIIKYKNIVNMLKSRVIQSLEHEESLEMKITTRSLHTYILKYVWMPCDNVVEYDCGDWIVIGVQIGKVINFVSMDGSIEDIEIGIKCGRIKGLSKCLNNNIIPILIVSKEGNKVCTISQKSIVELRGDLARVTGKDFIYIRYSILTFSFRKMPSSIRGNIKRCEIGVGH